MSDEMTRVSQFWNDIAKDFDAIYTGHKGGFGRALDSWLRKDMFLRFDWVMRKAGDVKGRRICDIGCGSGRYVAAFAKNGATEVVGIDVAPEMLKLARQVMTAAGVAQRCRFHLMDVIDWRSDEKFDTTIAIGFWDYIADPLSRLRIIRGITRGRFLSAWPRFGTWRMPLRKLRLSAQGCPVYFYRRSRVDELLRQSGFRAVSWETIGQLHCVEAVTSE
jgi:SAM-dependent methyltransferase